MMKKVIVNIHYVSRLFDPLLQLSDEQIHELGEINLNDGKDVNYLLTFIKDNFARYGPRSRQIVSNTLLYIMVQSREKISFSDIFPTDIISIAEPEDIILFIKKIWQILFKGKSVPTVDYNNLVLQKDYNAPNSVYIK